MMGGGSTGLRSVKEADVVSDLLMKECQQRFTFFLWSSKSLGSLWPLTYSEGVCIATHPHRQ